MDSSDVSTQRRVGVEAATFARPRRMSLDEDLFYRETLTARPTHPPSYDTAFKAALAAQRRSLLIDQGDEYDVPADLLPDYTCDVHMEGVFMRKMEIEDTIKRAELRNWQMVYVVLHGTALNIYHVKKDRSWWSTKNEGPGISPDNPPWISKGKLEKSYTLLHADAGIAADYRKRRNVIRLRAETDQFLLSCVELVTFITWLDRIFAAIDVAAPIDERDFPRDQSIPRVQRIRWFRGQAPRPGDNNLNFQRLNERRQSTASATTGGGDDEEGDAAAEEEELNMAQRQPLPPLPPPPPRISEENNNPDTGPSTAATSAMVTGRGDQHPVMGRLSTTSYPNESIDPETGKWAPRHHWTTTHDNLYAKLCFSVLLFKSPRKSNYIISKGKQWFVDWSTGRMIRVLPPAYGDAELFAPWHVITTENRFL